MQLIVSARWAGRPPREAAQCHLILFLPVILLFACSCPPLAGMTAEGDNRVLFQKVAKELTASTHTPAVRARLAAAASAPAVTAASVSSLEVVQALFVVREGRLLAQLLAAMSSAKGGAQVFEVWMRQQSDAVQHTATAYAEREVLQACVRALAAPGLSALARAVLEPVLRLYAVHRLEQVSGAGLQLRAATAMFVRRLIAACVAACVSMLLRNCLPAGGDSLLVPVPCLSACTFVESKLLNSLAIYSCALHCCLTHSLSHVPWFCRTWLGSSQRGWCRWRRAKRWVTRHARCAPSWRRSAACWSTHLAFPSTWWRRQSRATGLGTTRQTTRESCWASTGDVCLWERLVDSCLPMKH